MFADFYFPCLFISIDFEGRHGKKEENTRPAVRCWTGCNGTAAEPRGRRQNRGRHRGAGSKMGQPGAEAGGLLLPGVYDWCAPIVLIRPNDLMHPVLTCDLTG